MKRSLWSFFRQYLLFFNHFVFFASIFTICMPNTITLMIPMTRFELRTSVVRCDHSTNVLSTAVFSLKKWAIPGLYLFICDFSSVIKYWRWLDSNWGFLESEATSLPTGPQPLPVFLHKKVFGGKSERNF